MEVSIIKFYLIIHQIVKITGHQLSINYSRIFSYYVANVEKDFLIPLLNFGPCSAFGA